MGKPNVVITHSWSKNMGDLAVLITTIRMLNGIAPGCRINALVSHPDITRNVCPELDAEIDGWLWPIPANDKPGILDFLGYPAIFMSNIASAIIFRLFRRRVFIFNRNFSASLNRLFDCDAIISPGGDFIGPNYVFFTSFGELLMARILGKRSVICAQTIGPFRGLLKGALAAPALNLADLIIVRDERTASDLERIGVKNAHVTSDMAFDFTTVQTKSAKEQTGVLAMCPKRIMGRKQQYTERFRALTRRIIDELGYSIIYIPTDEYDLLFQKELAAGVGRTGIRVIDRVLPPHEIAEMISGCDFIVSSRMHAIILGSLSHTPFFAIGEGHKFSGVLEPLCHGCTLDISSFDEESMDRILGLINDRARLHREISGNFPRVREKTLENARIMETKFREWGVIGRR